MNSPQPASTPATRQLPKPPAWFMERHGPRPAAPKEFKFECPHCSQHFAADPSMAGRKLECPSCKQKFVIPNP